MSLSYSNYTPPFNTSTAGLKSQPGLKFLHVTSPLDTCSVKAGLNDMISRIRFLFWHINTPKKDAFKYSKLPTVHSVHKVSWNSIVQQNFLIAYRRIRLYWGGGGGGGGLYNAGGILGSWTYGTTILWPKQHWTSEDTEGVHILI